ncbi:MAG TPA: hypothetical protein VIK18_20105 [Pirellulales bacterium]
MFFVIAAGNFLTYGCAWAIFLGRVSHDHHPWVDRVLTGTIALLGAGIFVSRVCGFLHVPM